MTYEEMLRKGDAKATLAVLDIADRIALQKHGHPVRDWSVITKGTLPAVDELSINDDRAFAEAVKAKRAGEKVVTLTGLTPEQVLKALGNVLSEDAVEVAKESISIERTLDGLRA